MKYFFKKSLPVFFTFYFLLFNLNVFSQHNSAEIFQQMKKLKVLGSVLFIAAHPDDENTRLLTYLANEKLYRTGYLSLTRGDGGQNLIGDEQGIELGLIRTQELLAARRIDGAEQFFTRAFDFGYSKNPAETFTIWDHEKILSDAVWVVRKFQPDVIICRFPEDSRAGHGHHSASGIIAREVFDAAADPKRFPEQFDHGVQVWQAKRMLWNTFNFGGNSTVDSTQLSVDDGGFNPLLGKSYGEIAAVSRSQHKSQGFGVPLSRGSQLDFFNTIKGEKPKTDLTDGVETTWNRLDITGTIDKMIDSLLNNFRIDNPSKSVPDLVKIRAKVFQFADTYWGAKKLDEIVNLIADCAGLFVEAIAPQQFIPVGDSVKITVNMVNRSGIPMVTQAFILPETNVTDKSHFDLPINKNISYQKNIFVKKSFMETQPYWLREQMDKGMFNISKQENVGMAENFPLSVIVRVEFNNTSIQVIRPIRYKSNDPVKGERYNPIYLIPKHQLYSATSLILFKKSDDNKIKIPITVNSFENINKQKATLTVTGKNFSQTLTDTAFHSGVNSSKEYEMLVGNYLKKQNIVQDDLYLSFVPNVDSAAFTFGNSSRTIQYDHIPTIHHSYQNVVHVLNIDLKTIGKKIGYIEGAGDKVPAALQQMGYEVTILKEADLKASSLAQYDAIIAGVRAYNVHEYLGARYSMLMDYIKNGGNFIVQYNTNNGLAPLNTKLAPYPMKVSSVRVTDENAEVKFLLPTHDALNFPNKISSKDFVGWIQERSTYQAETTDPHFEMPLAMHDANEAETNGSLAIAKYGKGNFVYASLVFFRQLPAGVPGAFRLMANLIALPKNEAPTMVAPVKIK